MKNLKTRLTSLLNEELVFPDIKNLQQRGVADRIEDACNQIILKSFENVRLPKSNRTIEDIAVTENNIENLIDHKSSDVSRTFKMPNLVSITRLKKLTSPLYFNFVIYDSVKKEIINTFILNIYELNWEHLSIQNLGTGQLQIKNMKNFLDSPRTNLSEKEWKQRLQKEAIKFSKKLIRKTEKRIQEWDNWLV